MRILMGFRYGNICPADRMKLAFQKLGWEVIVAGPSSDPVVRNDIEEPDHLERIHAGIYYYDVEKIVGKWGQFDLILQVEPGTYFYNLEKVNTPNAIWLIDTLLFGDHPHVQRISGRDANYVDRLNWMFTSKLNHLPRYHLKGIKKVSHLPLAYDEGMHHEMSEEKVYDIVFCGRSDYAERKYFLDKLRLKYNVFVGTGLIYDHYCRKIAQGKIAFNHGHISEMNMRFFELMAMGAFQVCNLVHGQELLGFMDKVHLVNYTNDWDLFEVVDHYLRSDEECNEIAQAGKQKVLEGHSYMDRAKEILEQMSLA